ncbi:MAG TPA: hypothetical protein VHB53_12655, partial [Solirubrobacterales bacterium]|nr:hypothetical protein [Solirubrobacterales bacterium]
GTYFEAERRAEKQVDAVFTDFAASVSRRVGDLGIDHYGSFPDFGTDTASVFQIPDLTDPLSEAVLTPPAPFSGSATFRSDGARSGTWTGDLEVRLPGLPATPLTGDDIEAGLCVGDAGCTETLPKQLQPVLEAPPGTIVVVGIKKKTRRRTVRKVSNK